MATSSSVADDAATTLLSAATITSFGAFLAASYAALADSLATPIADFHADTTASLPAGAVFATLSINDAVSC